MNSNRTIYLTSNYLPPVQYYSKLLSYDEILIERFDNYTKQTYRNRCNIAGPGGMLSLSIPIIKPDTLKCVTKDIRISDHGNWRHLHWNSLETAYNSTPFFEYYKDDFLPFYERKYEFLFDFNEQLNELIRSLIDINAEIKYTSEYKKEISGNESDFREKIHPKKDFTIEDSEFTAQPYYQVFEAKYGFIPNLSIVDLLFNMGPESLLVLHQSINHSSR